MVDEGRGAIRRRAREAAARILKEANDLSDPAEAMTLVSHAAFPLLVAGYKITRDRGGAALGDAWLGRVFEGFAEILEEETGDAFRVRIERVEKEK